jgi:hypothetical protein
VTESFSTDNLTNSGSRLKGEADRPFRMWAEFLTLIMKGRYVSLSPAILDRDVSRRVFGLAS